MTSEYINNSIFRSLLYALTPPNRLALLLSLETGLRISDCLSLKTETLLKGQRFSVFEHKTGKIRRIYIPLYLYRELLANAGDFFVFPSRSNSRKHRTRQAVFKDLSRVAKMFRLSAHVSPHSARKIFAVDQFNKRKSLKDVQKLLNHSSEAVTLLYAMADELAARHNAFK